MALINKFNRNRTKFVLAALFLLFFVAIPFVHAQGLVACGKTNPNDCNFNALYDLIANIWDFLLKTVLVPVAIASIIFAGVKYVTAQGEQAKITEAHKTFYYVVIGIVIAFGAWLIVNTILKGLEAKPAMIYLRK